MITTYAELQDAVADWINRPEIEARLSTFVQMAEADMNRRVRHWRMEERSTITANDRYLQLPLDWVEAVRVSTTVDGVTRRLELAPHAAMLDSRTEAAGVAGVPKYYLLSGGEMELFPTPDGDYTVEMIYVGKIPALSDANTTNWVLENYPDAYLYGALTKAADFVADPRGGVWQPLFEKAIAEMNGSSDEARWSGTGLRLAKRGLA